MADYVTTLGRFQSLWGIHREHAPRAGPTPIPLTGTVDYRIRELVQAAKRFAAMDGDAQNDFNIAYQHGLVL